MTYQEYTRQIRNWIECLSFGLEDDDDLDWGQVWHSLPENWKADVTNGLPTSGWSHTRLGDQPFAKWIPATERYNLISRMVEFCMFTFLLFTDNTR
jgi:hypothetical protein